MTDRDDSLSWHRVADVDGIDEGRVRTVNAGHVGVCLSRFEGSVGAIDNRCPHQGGPLGEGSIERGWLRCPWHGYDYHPTTGKPPGGFSDGVSAFEVEERDDGIWVGVPPEEPRGRTVGDVMIDTMIAFGVTHVFGMVGHSNLGVADAMRIAEADGRLTYIGIRHEGAAAFAASAYGKLTGRPGACFAIAGPGSTNLLTGLYDAKVDGAPVLALSGQVSSKEVGRGAFQDLDLLAAFSDVATYSQAVLPASDHAELMATACKHAIQDRGVAHLVFPDEVPYAASDADPKSPVGRLADLAVAPPAAAFADAVALVDRAERPVVIVGHGAREHMGEVIALAEQLGAPVVTTFKAKGIVGDRHPLGAGVLGRSGTPVASWCMNESDLLIVFGASFSNHTGIADYKPIIQVDRDAFAVGRFHPVTVGLLGDVGVTARAIAEAARDDADRVDQRTVVAGRWEIWRDEKRRRATDDEGNGLSAAAIMAALTDAVPDDAVLCVDVGNNTAGSRPRWARGPRSRPTAAVAR